MKNRIPEKNESTGIFTGRDFVSDSTGGFPDEASIYIEETGVKEEWSECDHQGCSCFSGKTGGVEISRGRLPGRAENDPAEDTYRKITMIHCPGGCCCSGFLWSLSRESLDYIWLMEDFVFGDIRGSAIWSVQMDSVGKDVFPDEMELFLRMEKRLKRLQDKAFTSIAQSIREKSLKFSEKRCWQKNLQW